MIQSCIRRKQAHKHTLTLRSEARSVHRFAETSYQLESRVVDLISNLHQQREEKSRLKLKAVELENQVRAWISKYEQLDNKTRDVESLIGVHAGKVTDSKVWASARQKRESLQQAYVQSLNKIHLRDKELIRLKEELLGNSKARMERKSSDVNISELKNQISALKAATRYKMHV